MQGMRKRLRSSSTTGPQTGQDGFTMVRFSMSTTKSVVTVDAPRPIARFRKETYL
jgi:hypothetical protein